VVAMGRASGPAASLASRVQLGRRPVRPTFKGGLAKGLDRRSDVSNAAQDTPVKSGLFNRQLRQMRDLDLWIRVIAFYHVGRLDQELAARWVGRTSESNAIRATRGDWLDRPAHWRA
jgi:hypothetical protein